MKMRTKSVLASRPLCWACTLIGTVAAFAVIAAFAPSKPVYAAETTSLSQGVR